MGDKATVYFFRNFHAISGEFLTSRRPATPEAIKRARGEVITESAHEINASELDGDGFGPMVTSDDK